MVERLYVADAPITTMLRLANDRRTIHGKLAKSPSRLAATSSMGCATLSADLAHPRHGILEDGDINAIDDGCVNVVPNQIG